MNVLRPRSALLPLGLALALVAAQRIHAQDTDRTGTITGIVIETWHRKSLPGVVVTVRGTSLAERTGPDGGFTLEGVPPGDQAVVFSKPGYRTTIVTEVRVATGQLTRVDNQLDPDFADLPPYEVTAEELAGGMVEVLEGQKNDLSLRDSLGSESFSKLGVSDVAGALTKVTGATVADGKYAVVRGLADRYTFTTLNGMDLPSADPDRKAFQLDLLPSRFVERLDVRKTFTPDMGGGFAGGSIDIVGKSFPESFQFGFRVGTAYNTQSSLRDDFAATERGGSDWVAFDDGSRELPEVAADSDPSGSRILPATVKEAFGATRFTPRNIDSPLDSSVSLEIGDSAELFGKRVGYSAGWTHKIEYRYYDDGIVRSFQRRGTEVAIDKTDRRGVIDVQWGAIAALGLELSENHRFRYNFLYIQSAQDEARRLQGQDGDVTSLEDGTYTDQSILHWTERNLTYHQISGEHHFPQLHESARFDWGGALSTTTQDDPDYRIFQFLADPQNNFYGQTSSAQPSYPTRYWRELEEKNNFLRGDLTLPLPSYTEEDNLLKGGVALSQSERDYAQRGFSIRGTGRHPFGNTGDPDAWTDGENLQYINYYNFPVNINYHGEQEIKAGYLMSEISVFQRDDWPVFQGIRLIGGARYEATDLTIDAFNVTRNLAEPSGAKKQNDLLPCLSAIVQLTETIDLRLAWSRTVVRPTYREIGSVPIWDVTRNRQYTGNPELEFSESENVDARLAWYPRPGEVLAVSGFAKKITLPIELSSIRTDDTQITYENFEKADVLGFEGELRVRLDRIGLDAFSFGMNGAWITSEVPLTSDQIINRSLYGEESTTRPLYDQPSYIINGDLTWDNAATGTSITLSGGVVGDRLVLVGLARPDEFVGPSPDLNVTLSQKIGKHWHLGFSAKNLLNPEYQIVQTWPEAGETVVRSYTKGITLGLSLGAEF